MTAPTSRRRTHLRCALALTPKALDLLHDTRWVPVWRPVWRDDAQDRKDAEK